MRYIQLHTGWALGEPQLAEIRSQRILHTDLRGLTLSWAWQRVGRGFSGIKRNHQHLESSKWKGDGRVRGIDLRYSSLSIVKRLIRKTKGSQDLKSPFRDRGKYCLVTRASIQASQEITPNSLLHSPPALKSSLPPLTPLGHAVSTRTGKLMVLEIDPKSFLPPAPASKPVGLDAHWQLPLTRGPIV